MVSASLTTGSVTAPTNMHMGDTAIVSVSPEVHVAYFYGGKGQLAPGWYLLARQWFAHSIPLGGPFNTRGEAEHAWHYSESSNVREPAKRRLAFRHSTSELFDVSILRPGAIQMGQRARVDDYCKLEGGEGIVIGDFVHIASFCHLNIGGGLLIMEEGSSAASHAIIMSGSNAPDAPSCSATAPADQQRIERSITRIGKNATIFAGAIIAPGVTIGEGARILPGAVVRSNENIGPFETWAGVPAVFKKRDMQKFAAAGL